MILSLPVQRAIRERWYWSGPGRATIQGANCMAVREFDKQQGAEQTAIGEPEVDRR